MKRIVSRLNRSDASFRENDRVNRQRAADLAERNDLPNLERQQLQQPADDGGIPDALELEDVAVRGAGIQLAE